MNPEYGRETFKVCFNSKGVSILTAVILLLFFSVLGFGVLGMISVGSRGSGKMLASQQAFQIAEAGRQYGLWAYEKGRQLTENTESPEHPVGDGSFTLEFTDSDGLKRIISRGYVPGRENYRAKRVVLTTFLTAPSHLANIFSYDSLSVKGNVKILGYDWEIGEYMTDYTVASNAEFELVGGAYEITADEQVEDSDMEFDPVEIPPELEEMDYTREGDPGLSGGYSIQERADGSTDFSMEGDGDEAAVLSGDYKFESLKLASDAELTIDGAARMYVLESFSMSGGSKIILTEGSSLELYIGEGGAFSISGNAGINPDGAPSDVEIYAASDTTIEIVGTSVVKAVIYAPESDMNIRGDAELWGAVISGSLELEGNVKLVYVAEGEGEEESGMIIGEFWGEAAK